MNKQKISLLFTVLLCAVIFMSACGKTDLPEESEDTYVEYSKDEFLSLSTGSNKHSIQFFEDGVSLSAEVAAFTPTANAGGFAGMVYNKDLSGEDLSAQIDMLSCWRNGSEEYSFFTIYFASGAGNWALQKRCILIQIFPAAGDTTEGGTARIIFRDTEYGDYYEVSRRMNFMPKVVNNQKTNIVLAEFKNLHSNKTALYLNEAKLSELRTGTLETVADVDALVHDFLLRFNKIYLGITIEYFGECEEASQSGVFLSKINGNLLSLKE